MWITREQRKGKSPARVKRASTSTRQPRTDTATARARSYKFYMVMPSLRNIFLLAGLLLTAAAFGQKSRSGARPPDREQGEMTAQGYIEQWKGVAAQKMKDHGIPASITIAQGLLESRNGNSELAREANNHFGIKCTNDWDGGKAYHDDDRKRECFRKYDDAADCFEDHSRFLKRTRYADLFKLRSTDYKGWAHGLKRAGYATDPKYPQKLINLIERYELNKLDEGVDIVYAPQLPGDPTRPGRIQVNDGVEINVGGRLVELFDGRIKFIRARQGDSLKKIAAELEMMPGQLARYNDMEREAPVAAGQVIYLQPKRSKSKSAAVHVVHEGETLWSISQERGVKLEKLAEYNGLAEDAALTPGQQLVLKKPRR